MRTSKTDQREESREGKVLLQLLYVIVIKTMHDATPGSQVSMLPIFLPVPGMFCIQDLVLVRYFVDTVKCEALHVGSVSLLCFFFFFFLP